MKKSYYELLQTPQPDELSTFFDRYQLAVRSIYVQDTTSALTLKNHITQSHKLIYVCEGEIESHINGKRYQLKKGSMAMSGPNTLLKTCKQNRQRFTCVHIFFDLQPAHLASAFLDNIYANCGEYICFQDESLALYPLIERLISEFEKQESGFHVVSNQLLHFLVVGMMREQMELQTLPIQHQPSFEDEGSRLIHQALTYIDSEIAQPIKVKTLSMALGVSENHLYKLFKKHLQQSPVQYIAEYKLQRACVMLASQTYTIQEIADHLGYSSLFHFSTAFKKKMGMPPSAYFESIEARCGVDE